jgi:hypothetical protein
MLKKGTKISKTKTYPNIIFRERRTELLLKSEAPQSNPTPSVYRILTPDNEDSLQKHPI